MDGTAHDIGPVDQVPPGEGRNFRIGDLVIAVFHTRNGSVFATQPDCPHQLGPLADGLLGGSTVICPLHERVFDLRSGEEAGSQCRIRTYPALITETRTLQVIV